jgi:hypothetical protein
VSTDTGPTIVGAALGPGHDGRAEVVVELAYPNGGRSRLSVAEEAATRALDAAGLGSLTDLVGQPWTVLVIAPHA